VLGPYASRAQEEAGALATNSAGNFHRALGCADTAVYFRNQLRSGPSGETQIGLPALVPANLATARGVFACPASKRSRP